MDVQKKLWRRESHKHHEGATENREKKCTLIKAERQQSPQINEHNTEVLCL